MTTVLDSGNKEHFEEDNYFAKLRGSDPRVQTCRGRMQTKRSKLNQEINKELMLRSGAEKLYKATTNRKLREHVALELSYVNSNLQLLQEQLAEMNSSVDLYQDESAKSYSVPMLPLGLKETKELDFRDAFKDVILEHYSEDPVEYDTQILEFMKMRQGIRTPTRDQQGVSLLLKYFNQLCLVERRFFAPERNMGLHFEWYDALTGSPSSQRTIAFEKASVLFNIAALYTQIGAKQDRNKSKGIDAAVDNFLRAAGVLHYVQNRFSQAPSMDLTHETVNMLVNLFLAQARECLFEKLTLTSVEKKGIEACLEVSQEAAQVAEVYNKVHACISAPPVKDYVPYSWISLILVKVQHYRALSHYYTAAGLIDFKGELGPTVRDLLTCIQIYDTNKSTLIDIKVPANPDERRQLGKSHLREALFLHEESLRVHRMCRLLRKVDSLLEALKKIHDRALNKYADVEEEDDFQEILDPPKIQASTKYQLTLTFPDFSQYKVKDLFHSLGPIMVFSAKHHWSAPRTLQLSKTSTDTFGFSVKGDCPVMIANVDSGSLAEIAGMKEGDFIVKINSVDAKWSHHEDVVAAIKASKDCISLKLVTPMHRDFQKPRFNPSHTISSSGSSSSSGLSSVSPTLDRVKGSTVRSRSVGRSPTGSLISKLGGSNKKLTWSIFRRSASKEKSDRSLR